MGGGWTVNVLGGRQYFYRLAQTRFHEVPMYVQQSEELADWIDSKIRNLECPGGIRARFSVSCFDIVHEHYRSIVLLVANCLYGSAFALVRSIYETFVRGVWIWECATEEQIQKIMKKDKIDPSLKCLISDIEKKGKNWGQALNGIREKHWSSFNSFTHTGFQQIARRNTQKHIESNYDEHEIEYIIGFVDALALLAGFRLAIIADHSYLAAELGEKTQQYVDKTP